MPLFRMKQREKWRTGVRSDCGMPKADWRLCQLTLGTGNETHSREDGEDRGATGGSDGK